jgi:hypothetical protein
VISPHVEWRASVILGITITITNIVTFTFIIVFKLIHTKPRPLKTTYSTRVRLEQSIEVLISHANIFAIIIWKCHYLLSFFVSSFFPPTREGKGGQPTFFTQIAPRYSSISSRCRAMGACDAAICHAC